MAIANSHLTVRRTTLDGLTPAEAAAWTRLHGQSRLKSPLTSLDFARLASEALEDVEVVVASLDGEPGFFLPYHRRSNRFARPVGGAFSDLHGPIATPALAMMGAEILRRAGLSGFRFHGLEDPAGAFNAGVISEDMSYSIVLKDDAAAYLAQRRAEHSKQIKNYVRLEAKLEREAGDLELIADDTSHANFQDLLGWKHRQLAETGLFNYLEAPRVRTFLERARQRCETNGLQGLMLTLTLGGKPIAGHFGVRLGEVYHPWIAAYDPVYARYSPGLILIRRAIEAMPNLGLATYELGAGHSQYKKVYAAQVTSIGAGVVFGGGFSGAVERAGEAMAQSLERFPEKRISSAVQRMRRRADVIASAEQRKLHRVGAFADALLRRGFAPAQLAGVSQDG